MNEGIFDESGNFIPPSERPGIIKQAEERKDRKRQEAAYKAQQDMDDHFIQEHGLDEDEINW